MLLGRIYSSKLLTHFLTSFKVTLANFQLVRKVCKEDGRLLTILIWSWMKSKFISKVIFTRVNEPLKPSKILCFTF